jgi:L-aspartate oxidase
VGVRLVESDFLVIGSGVAGLLAAIKLAPLGTVTIVTKKQRSDSNTNYAQGGIAVPVGRSDSVALHMKDTMAAGCGLCHEDVVDFVVRNSRARLDDLLALGVAFTEEAGGGQRFALGREGGHSANRILHAMDYTGREIETVLLERAKSLGNIAFFENHIGVDLILESRCREDRLAADRCWGAYVMDEQSRSIVPFRARATLLATGGAGKVYLYTSNPDIATGDGIAMAYRAGARVGNLEFVQFHPTCLYHPLAKSFLISEAVRGEGALLVAADGDRFMPRYHQQAELAPRDVVARAVDREMKRRGEKCVFLDLGPIGSARIKKRFPSIYEKCLSLGMDITREPIPVVPAAHYMCGGVVADLAARTTIGGLLCAGETALTGLHGANRLASNSLLEAAVFADAAAKSAASVAEDTSGTIPRVEPWHDEGTAEPTEVVVFDHDWDEVRSLMWDYVGIVRSDDRLAVASRRLDLFGQQIDSYYRKYRLNADLIELRNITHVAQLIVRCATLRRESRGLHYNIDCPETDDANWRRDTIL